MIETNETVRIVPRQERPLRVFQLVPSKESCRYCPWDADCGERTTAFERTGRKREQCAGFARKDKTSQVMKEI